MGSVTEMLPVPVVPGAQMNLGRNYQRRIPALGRVRKRSIDPGSRIEHHARNAVWTMRGLVQSAMGTVSGVHYHIARMRVEQRLTYALSEHTCSKG